MHDGVVTDGKIDTQNVVDEYRERTGFDISLEGKDSFYCFKKKIY